MTGANEAKEEQIEGIAIIGISGRFPGARNVDQFWNNLKNGVESISFFSDEELIASGIDPAALNDPNYVKAKAALDDIESFDASFFGITPREAEIMDPQHRLFLECAWESLEDAGYDPERYPGLIGVYAGASVNNYFMFNLQSNRELIATMGEFQTLIENDKDYLTTRVSYKLNLKGPSIAIQTACSTSLVAVHLACQGLLNYQCDMALAGGVSVGVPNKVGYLYQQGGIVSPDGHCRAFDAEAQGTVGGDGVGIVVLKRAHEALADGDHIYALIKGSAVNNDGSFKVGYTAPSVQGQKEVITLAQAVAAVEPQTIQYVEAHGTGTPLGDPIEIAALTQAFRTGTDAVGFCAIGSVKTNIGHLDAAAGVAGLIKATLSLKHKLLPPSLHFNQPNPKIDFAATPFFVNKTLSEWPATGTPRRAAVSSFGIGGTNAHVILEEAPGTYTSEDTTPWQLLTLSAKTSSALDAATTHLVRHLQRHPQHSLADVAFTLQTGRKSFRHKRMVVCRDTADAVTALESLDPARVFSGDSEREQPPVVFMFPGQGAQYVNMGAELYQHEPFFREQVDRCSALLEPHLGLDLRALLYPPRDQAEAADQELQQTAITQPALFVLEYALARLWVEWGVRPHAMIGHSIGEYAAACLAGVFSLEDALSLVATRGRLMQQLPGGSMIAILLPESEIQPYLDGRLSLAALNGPANCVLSGSTEDINTLENQLASQGVLYRRLRTSHSFHSSAMEPIIETFVDTVRKVNLGDPTIPYLSNVSGTWINASEATDPYYWGRQLRHPVRFSEGIAELLQAANSIFLEVGPGRTLASMVHRHPARRPNQAVFTSLRHPRDKQSDHAFLQNTVGRLWLEGISINWSGMYKQQRRRRLPLPTYPFERKRYWVEPGMQQAGVPRQATPGPRQNITEWFYAPSWQRSTWPGTPHPQNLAQEDSCWLLFMDANGLGAAVATQLNEAHQDVIAVQIGRQFAKTGKNAYEIRPGHPDDYHALLGDLRSSNQIPDRFLHFWTVGFGENTLSDADLAETVQDLSFSSLVYFVQALGERNATDTLRIAIISNNLHEIIGGEQVSAEKALLLGPCKVIPQEFPDITCVAIDVEIPAQRTSQEQQLAQRLIAELLVNPTDQVVAYRGRHRWVQTFQPIRLHDNHSQPPLRLREEGVYLITGGLGSMGLAFARYLAQTVRARLILVGRSALPPRDEWARWLPEDLEWISEVDRDERQQTQIRLRKLQELEELGSEILVATADVTAPEQMQSVLDHCYERFGALHGVIHTAGILGQGIAQLKTPDEMKAVLAPKVRGTTVLGNLLKHQQLDFILLCSSLSAISPLIGQIDYSAANAFLDAFAHRWASQNNGTPMISINWGFWQELGLAAKAKIPVELKKNIETSLRKGPLANAGTEVLNHVLSWCTIPQVIVSPEDIQVALERMKSAPPAPFSATGTVEASSRPKHPRPELEEPYAAPRTEVEELVATIWQQLLGIEQIGIHDDFFSLGGDSLLAVQVISRVRETLRVELPLRNFFDAPTIREMAKGIEEAGENQPAPLEQAITPLSREAFRVRSSTLESGDR